MNHTWSTATLENETSGAGKAEGALQPARVFRPLTNSQAKASRGLKPTLRRLPSFRTTRMHTNLVFWVPVVRTG
jgi:hypothetical protein